MVAFRVPKRSNAHRAAALALFRALLIQSRAAPFPLPQRVELQNFIRNRFKQSRHVTSLRWLRVSFEAGYEAIDHLDAAVAGDESSRVRILSLLQGAHEKTKQSHVWSSWAEKRRKEVLELKKERGTTDMLDSKCSSIFDRPRPSDQLSGRRHVPVLFSANGIPVLRIKKPMSQKLSGYIANRIKNRQARHDRRQVFDQEIILASYEDVWDRSMKTLALSEANPDVDAFTTNEPTWQAAIRAAAFENQRHINMEREKNRNIAEKMQAIVDREQELYNKENNMS